MDHINQVVIPSFKAATGVDVIFEFTTWDQRMDQILIGIAGDSPHDIVYTGYYSPYEEGSTGLLEPLDRYIAGWKHRDKYPEPLWDTQRWNGQTWVVPYEVQIRGIGYNKELFAQSGLDPHRPPQSWDELLQHARTLTHLSDATVTQRGISLNRSGGGAAQDLFWWIMQTGLTEFDRETYRSNLNRPEAYDALTNLVALQAAAHGDLSGAGGGLAGGSVAMARVAPGFQNSILQADPDGLERIGVFAPQQSIDSNPVAFGSVQGWGITAASRNKDRAWEFLTFLMDDEALLAMQLSTGWITGRTDMAAELSGLLPGAGLFFDIFAFIHGPMIPPPRNISQDDIARYLAQVYSGVMSPTEALSRAHQTWEQLLDDWTANMRR